MEHSLLDPELEFSTRFTHDYEGYDDADEYGRTDTSYEALAYRHYA